MLITFYNYQKYCIGDITNCTATKNNKILYCIGKLSKVKEIMLQFIVKTLLQIFLLGGKTLSNPTWVDVLLRR